MISPTRRQPNLQQSQALQPLPVPRQQRRPGVPQLAGFQMTGTRRPDSEYGRQLLQRVAAAVSEELGLPGADALTGELHEAVVHARSSRPMRWGRATRLTGTPAAHRGAQSLLPGHGQLGKVGGVGHNRVCCPSGPSHR